MPENVFGEEILQKNLMRSPDKDMQLIQDVSEPGEKRRKCLLGTWMTVKLVGGGIFVFLKKKQRYVHYISGWALLWHFKRQNHCFFFKKTQNFKKFFQQNPPANLTIIRGNHSDPLGQGFFVHGRTGFSCVLRKAGSYQWFKKIKMFQALSIFLGIK